MEGLYLDEQFFVPNLDSPIKILKMKINYKKRDFIWLGWVALSQVELTMAELEFEFWNTVFLLENIITSFKYNWEHLS